VRLDLEEDKLGILDYREKEKREEKRRREEKRKSKVGTEDLIHGIKSTPKRQQ